MLKKVFAIFALITAINMSILSSIDQSSANQVNSITPQQKEILANNMIEFQKNSKDIKLNQKQIDQIKSKIKNIKVHGEELNYNLLFAKKYKSNKYVYIPIKYNNVREDMNYSHLALVLDNKNNISNYIEYRIIGNDKNYTADAAVYTNGILSKQEILQMSKEDFKGNSNISLIGEKQADALNWWGRFERCMSNLGVASWVLGVISWSCSAICVATAGSGCVACIVAAGLATEGVAAKCVTEASLKKS